MMSETDTNIVEETTLGNIDLNISEAVEETAPIELTPITEPELTDQLDGPVEQLEVTIDDCEMLYGVCMETAHSIIGTRKGNGHRELPDERRKAQGKLLYNICKKYNITIPTELELVIFGGAMIADWQHMTIKAEDTNIIKEPVNITVNEGEHNNDEIEPTETTDDSN